MCEIDTYYADELGEGHLDGDGHLLALVDSRPDQFVVTLRTQQVVHQPLFGVLCLAACKGTGGGGVTSDRGTFAPTLARCLHDRDSCRSNVY